jgi:hypothetical protein
MIIPDEDEHGDLEQLFIAVARLSPREVAMVQAILSVAAKAAKDERRRSMAILGVSVLSEIMERAIAENDECGDWLIDQIETAAEELKRRADQALRIAQGFETPPWRKERVPFDTEWWERQLAG